jgi:hypothetical protein
LSAEQVGSQFDENERSVEDETVTALRTLRQHLAGIDEIVAVFGGAGPTELNHLEGHVARSRVIVDRSMKAAPPGSRGKTPVTGISESSGTPIARSRR